MTAALEEEPGGDGRVEAAGDQAHRPALHAQRETARTLGAAAEEVCALVAHFDMDGDLGRGQVDGAVGVEGGAEFDRDVARREGVAAGAAGGDGVAVPRDGVPVGVMTHPDNRVEVGREHGVHPGERVDAEDAGGGGHGLIGGRRGLVWGGRRLVGGGRGARGWDRDEQPAPPVADGGCCADGPEGVAEVGREALLEASPRAIGLARDFGGQADEVAGIS